MAVLTIEADWLQRELGVAYTADVLSKIAEMDNYHNLEQLGELGKRAADVQVKAEHFPTSFNVA